VPTDQPADVLAAFGHAVRGLRLERGFSQERLAEESGLHPRYISDVERGRRNISLRNIERLGVALSVDLPTLMSATDQARGA
jgi:transcriptional regulator with XRE-family HTH domain